MRTTLAIDDDLLLAAKSLAQSRSTSLGAAVSELMRRGLERDVSVRRADGFPVFDVPRGSPPITLQDVKKLEDEI